ncbi:hypothetical protein H8I69_11105 [Serratia fonticola]|uniref:hypothetical protein n=1 Tax=Serratia fonticola TaxID=47917 RepID=UPI0015C68070|nr:hypothetical protein [Serratia fonticola]MBC3379656.1 hypothetical protein [Serratia fonticola]NYA38856.1 hypothetical protein [Serratia fonticola]
MKRVWIGFQISLPTLLLVIATSLLSGCVKTDSVAKTRLSGNSVDDLFTPLNGGTPNASGVGGKSMPSSFDTLFNAIFTMLIHMLVNNAI